MRVYGLVVGVAVAGFGASGSLDAQVSRRWGLEVTAGISRGTGGHYHDRSRAPSLDALVSWRLSGGVGHAPTAAVSAGFLGMGGYDAVCHEDGAGGCVPAFPHLSYRAALIGWEWMHRRGASGRLLVGPASVRGGVPTVATTGVQGRVEVSPLRVNALAPVLAFRVTRVPNYEGAALQLWGWGLGIRFR